MDAFAIADELVALAFRRRSMHEPRIPGQWNCDRPAIVETHCHRILGKMDGLGKNVALSD